MMQCASNAQRPRPSIKSASDALKVVASLPNAARFVAKQFMSMDEDCLFLNVYSPVAALPAEKLMPVLVWIHGGKFLGGSGSYMIYGPEYLMDQRVVLVTLNYRLGPLGFLSSNTSDAPGNAGLKDQRMALGWVRDNIKAFGGDPERITIYGQSAGAVAVHMHVLSPSSKGLFSAAILSSGAAQDLWAVQPDPADVSRRLAEAMGAGADTVADVKRRIQFLRDAPYKDIIDSLSNMGTERENRMLDTVLPFVPVVEPPDSEEEAFLDKHPNTILHSGDFNKVPMIIGLNDKEGSPAYRRNTEEELSNLEANPMLLLPSLLYDRVDANTRENLANKIKEVYFRGRPISVDTLPMLADVAGDEAVSHGVHVATHWHLKHATPDAPVRLYWFALDAFGTTSFMTGVSAPLKGAGHGDDIGYVFRNHLISDAGTTEKERVEKGTARMATLIGNFVTQGNPTPSTTDLITVDWPPASLEKPSYLEIADDLIVKDDPILDERMRFWDNILQETIPDPVYGHN